MGFNFKAFATAFLNRSAERMDESTEEAKKYREQQEAAAEKAKALYDKRKANVERASALAKQAKINGATDEMISAALASGPTGIVDLSQKLNEIRIEQGDNWDAETARAAYHVSPGYTAPEMSLEEQLRQTYGLPEATTGSTTVEDEGFLSYMFGDSKKYAKAALDRDTFYGGYSVLDLNEMAAANDYKSLSEGSFVQYVAPKIFTQAGLDKEQKTIDNRYAAAVKGVKSLPEYVKLADEIKRLESTTVMESSEDYIANQTLLSSKRSQLREMERTAAMESLEAHARQQMSYYRGGGYMDIMGSYYDSLGFPGFSKMLNGDIEDTDNEAEEGFEGFMPKNMDATISAVEGMGGTYDVQDGKVVVSHTGLKGLKDSSMSFGTASDGSLTSVTIEVGGKPKTFTNPDAIRKAWSLAGKPPVVDSNDPKAVNTGTETPPVVVETDTMSPRLDGKDGSKTAMKSYQQMYDGLMALPEEQRSTYLNAFDDLKDIKPITETIAEVLEEVPGAVDKGAGYVLGGGMWALGAFNNALTSAYNFMTGDTATAAKVRAQGKRNKDTAHEIMADGVVKHLQQAMEEEGLGEAFTADRAARIKGAVLRSQPILDAAGKLVDDIEAGADVLGNILTPPSDLATPLNAMGDSFIEWLGVNKDASPEDVADKLQSTVNQAESEEDKQKLGDYIRQQLGSSYEAGPGVMVPDIRNALNKVLDMVTRDGEGLIPDIRTPEAKVEAKDDRNSVELAEAALGSKSPLFEEYKTAKENGTLTTGDLARMIKAAKALPATETRSKLLEALYEERDSLSNL